MYFLESYPVYFFYIVSFYLIFLFLFWKKKILKNNPELGYDISHDCRHMSLALP
jgi:hypothetical protein